MTRQILLPASVLREMRETFKVGRNVLRRALNYERNSDRAKALRAAALERGGLIYTGEHAPKGYCPNVETRHDHVWKIQCKLPPKTKRFCPLVLK